LEHDSSLSQLADLPAGWVAHRRKSTGPWRREVLPPEGDDQ
jgi:hypothetical protein